MDLSFSATPQTLIPSACSRTFHLLAISRREFVGCGHHLSPPGLRCRKTRGKLGFHILYPRRILFRDSIYENSIIVISTTVAAFAAIQLLHLNRSGRRDSENEVDNECTQQEISDLLAIDEPSENTDIPQKECCSKQFSTSESLCTNPTFFDTSSSTKAHVLSCKDGELLNTHAAVPSQEMLVDEPFPLTPTASMLAKTGIFGPKDDLVVGKMKSTENGSPVFDKSDFKSGNSVQFLPISNLFVIYVKSKQREFSHSHGHVIQQHLEDKSELLISNYSGDKSRSIKKASDYCKQQLEIRSISCFNRLNKKPLNRTLKNDDSYHESKLSVKRAKHPGKGSLKAAENSDFPERHALFMSFNKNFSSKEMGLDKGNSLARDFGKNVMWKHETRHLPRFLDPNEGLVKDSSNLETCLRTYDCLIRDLRLHDMFHATLKDSLDLLESMERKGLLDMEKVHHTRFLNYCKNQKAVKEAFRFCKLINKPTLSMFNMLLSVCANSQDFKGAFEVMLQIKDSGLKPDCKLYTTLISACGKCGKVDAMFEVFHEMFNAGVEPNVNTYGALIDGCARAGQVAKAFGAYGIMRSKNVQPDRVVFNALITACGRSGAVDRAFDVLTEMRAEPKPIDPDHITIGALIKACVEAGQAKRAHDVYRMLHLYNIKGTPDVYTIAVNSCCQSGDLEFALSIYNDMKENDVEPDEMFLSTIIDAAGHAQNLNAAFTILKDARNRGILVGSMTYSSLMGACCNAKNWKKALELYDEIKAIKLLPTVSTLNALITALCDGDQLPNAVEVLDEMKEAGVIPNIVTYSILTVACEKKSKAELGFTLLSKAKSDGILPNLIMCRCLTGLCLRSYERACSLGEPIVSFNSGNPQIDSIWTSRAIMVYRETISSGEIPTIEVFSQVLGCLKFPSHSLIRNSFIENLVINFDASSRTNISSYLHGFGEYDVRSFSVLVEAASLQVVPQVSFKESPIVLDARKLLRHTAEVYILTILKGLKHRLAAGARLPCITILLPRGKTVIESPKGERTVYIAARVGQAVGSLLRRLRLQYQGDESYGKIRLNGLTLRRWFKPKLANTSVSGRPGEMIPTPAQLAKGIANQQRNIRSNSNFSLE